MGLGDWIMATSQVKSMYAELPQPVLICNPRGRVQWCEEVFANNPKITREGGGNNVRMLMNAPGSRPYILAKSAARWYWKRWPIRPGELFLTDQELQFAPDNDTVGAIVLEPHTKVPNSNKTWPWERWQEVANALKGERVVQIGPPGSRVLRNVRFVETPSFRNAIAVLAAGRAFVGAEGALHHAAAAVGLPAVVLFSEYISPVFTGYKTHRNLRHAGDPCGARMPCRGCRQSMEAITAHEVLTNLAEIT